MGTSAVGLAPGLSRKLKKVLECRTDTPDLVSSLNTLSTFYTENTARSRRNLRSAIETRALSINLEFLQASDAAQKGLDSIEGEVTALSDCCDRYAFVFAWGEIRWAEISADSLTCVSLLHGRIAKALNSCIVSTGDIISTTEMLKQELEATTQRQEIASCFLRDYQLSNEEVLDLFPMCSFVLLLCILHQKYAFVLLHLFISNGFRICR